MKKTRKILLIALFLCFLILIYIYTCAISAIPSSIILFQGEELNLKTIFGISLINKEDGNEAILASTDIESDIENSKLGTKDIEVKLFNTVTVKDVSVSVIERTTVIPIGQVGGLKLYTSGVLVVGMSEIKGEDNQKYKPYEDSGIEEGDTIIQIDDTAITDTDTLVDVVNESNGETLQITYLRDGVSQECSITPVKTSEVEYKLGLWVRDSAAGIGTLTYYEPSTGYYAALGHGITDVDTGELLDISNGEFITTKILSIIKGKEGEPGKIQGSIYDQKKIGTIYKNSNLGIYGVLDDVSLTQIDLNNKMEVALRDEIKLGEAKILCSLDGEKAKEYTIEIEKIYLNNNYDNKSMLIKVTDEDLIEKTGGIIQGMSGCPVIQNGKFIGAITNVLVNDPQKGYVVFGDLMIKEMMNLGTEEKIIN